MILLDTCALVFDALAPDRLSSKAQQAIDEGEKNNDLTCSDISLWEIAMLIGKGRLDPGTDALSFLKLVLAARMIRPLSITAEIAAISADEKLFHHHDPADRIIAATAFHYQGRLVTCDARIQSIEGLTIVW